MLLSCNLIAFSQNLDWSSCGKFAIMMYMCMMRNTWLRTNSWFSVPDWHDQNTMWIKKLISFLLSTKNKSYNSENCSQEAINCHITFMSLEWGTLEDL